MGVKSKRKGNRYELRVAKLLSEFTGRKFRRTPSSGAFNKQGSTLFLDRAFSGDIVPIMEEADTSKFAFSVEAKSYYTGFNMSSSLTSNTNLFYQWWEQCCDDAKTVGLMPLLFFKPNYKDDFVALNKKGAQTLKLTKSNVPRMVLTLSNSLPDAIIVSWDTIVENSDGHRMFQG